MIDHVHHYCSPSVFLSLIKNKELWLTSLAHSNDREEGTWMLDHWLDKFDRDDAKQRHLRTGAKLTVGVVLRQYVALGTCFSEERDLLSQWRGYAHDGAGFSVTFDKGKLDRLCSDFEGGSTLKLSKVSYGYQDHEQVTAIVKSLHQAFGNDAAKYVEATNGYGHMSLSFTPEKTQLQKNAARDLFTVKNGAFKEEREWRLFLFSSLSDITNIEFRESADLISPFVRLKIPPDVIVGVTLGPSNRTPSPMIEAALDANGIESWLKVSSASYRNR